MVVRWFLKCSGWSLRFFGFPPRQHLPKRKIVAELEEVFDHKDKLFFIWYNVH